MQRVLSGLHDVQGVVGSFVSDPSGRLLAASTPAFIGADELRAAVPRILSVLDAVAELDPKPEWCTLYFSEYRLYALPFEGGCLVVLGEPETNLRALRLATRLVRRKLQRILDGAPASSGNSDYGEYVSNGPSAHAPTSQRQPSYFPPPIPTDRTPPSQAPDSLRGFEVHATGTLTAESYEVVNPAELQGDALRRTQPSLPLPQLPHSNVAKAGPPGQDPAPMSDAPDVQTQGPIPSSRTIVYRGRRYQVPG